MLWPSAVLIVSSGVQKYFVSMWSHLLNLGLHSFTVAALGRVVVNLKCLKGVPVVSSRSWSHLGFRIPVYFYFIFIQSESNFTHPQVESQSCQ